jgi:hypothetical protein
VAASGGFSCASPDAEANNSAVASMHAKARAIRSLYQRTNGCSPKRSSSESGAPAECLAMPQLPGFCGNCSRNSPTTENWDEIGVYSPVSRFVKSQNKPGPACAGVADPNVADLTSANVQRCQRQARTRQTRRPVSGIGERLRFVMAGVQASASQRWQTSLGREIRLFEFFQHRAQFSEHRMH